MKNNLDLNIGNGVTKARFNPSLRPHLAPQYVRFISLCFLIVFIFVLLPTWHFYWNNVLIAAVKADQVNIASNALSKGADPNVCDNGTFNKGFLQTIKEVFSPAPRVQVSPIQKHSRIESYLTEPNNNVDNSKVTYNLTKPVIIIAAEHKNALIIKQLIRYGGNVNAIDEQGNDALTTLYYADTLGELPQRASFDSPVYHDAALALIGANANVNAQNRYGAVALFQTGDPDVIRALIEHGANVNCRNLDNETPLMNASRLQSITAVTILLSHGADPNPKGVSCSPFEWAKMTQNHTLMEFLVHHGAKTVKP